MVKRASWLSVTPEPERELPMAVATLVHGGTPPPSAIASEQARIERLVLRGNERAWLDYLHGVLELIERDGGGGGAGGGDGGAGAGEDDEVARARARAAAVIANHHNLLLGLPGRGAQRTATDRARLADKTPTKGRT